MILRALELSPDKTNYIDTYGWILFMKGDYVNAEIWIKKALNKTFEKDGNEIIHRGISQRSFSKSFTIADDVKVNGAELKDGLLTINCEKIVPEQKKKKLIPIN